MTRKRRLKRMGRMILLLIICISLAGCYSDISDYNLKGKDYSLMGLVKEAAKGMLEVRVVTEDPAGADLDGKTRIVTLPGIEQLRKDISRSFLSYGTLMTSTASNVRLLYSYDGYEYAEVPDNGLVDAYPGQPLHVKIVIDVHLHFTEKRYQVYESAELTDVDWIHKVIPATVVNERFTAWSEDPQGPEHNDKTILNASGLSSRTSKLFYYRDDGSLVLFPTPLPDDGLVETRNGDRFVVLEMDDGGVVLNQAVVTARSVPKFPGLNVELRHLPGDAYSYDDVWWNVQVRETIPDGHRLVYKLLQQDPMHVPGYYPNTIASSSTEDYMDLPANGNIRLGLDSVAVAEVDADGQLARIGIGINTGQDPNPFLAAAEDPIAPEHDRMTRILTGNLTHEYMTDRSIFSTDWLAYKNFGSDPVPVALYQEVVRGFQPLPKDYLVEANDGDHIAVAVLDSHNHVIYYGAVQAVVVNERDPLTVTAEFWPQRGQSVELSDARITVAEPPAPGTERRYAVVSKDEIVSLIASLPAAARGFASLPADGIIPLGRDAVLIVDVEQTGEIRAVGTASANIAEADRMIVLAHDPKGAAYNGMTQLSLVEGTVSEGRRLFYANIGSDSPPFLYRNTLSEGSPVPENGLIPAATGDRILVQEADENGRIQRYGTVLALAIDEAFEPPAVGPLTVSATTFPGGDVFLSVNEPIESGQKRLYRIFADTDPATPQVGEPLSGYSAFSISYGRSLIADLLRVQANPGDRIAVADVTADNRVIRFGWAVAPEPRVPDADPTVPRPPLIRMPTWPTLPTPSLTLAPVADQSNREGETVSMQLNVSPGDLRNLSFRATGLPNGLSLNSSTGEITGMIGYDNANATVTSVVYNVNVTASAAGFASAGLSFDWTIHDTDTTPHVYVVDQPADPVSGEVHVSTPAADYMEITVEAYDDDGDELEFMIAVAWERELPGLAPDHFDNPANFSRLTPMYSPLAEFVFEPGDAPNSWKIIMEREAQIPAGSYYQFVVWVRDKTPHPTDPELDSSKLTIIWHIE